MRGPWILGSRWAAFTLVAASGSCPLAICQIGVEPPGVELPADDSPAPQGESIDGLSAGMPPIELPKGPWRLSEALGTPEWFEIGGSIRGRFEHTSERFRLNQDGHNQIFVLRSLLAMTVRDEFLSATVELEDSRAYGFPDDTLLGTGSVNAVELLQGYIAGRFEGAFQAGDSLDVQAGRHTMDVGSRRMVARNRYRNTINSFLGLNTQWTSSGDAYARAFYTHPTTRLPTALDQDAIQDNQVEFDEEYSKNQFWGLFGSHKDLVGDMDAELYYYGLRRSDVRNLAVADRNIHTVGTRWFKPRVPGELFWEVEAAYQFGTSRNAGSSTVDLDHAAYFAHASLGHAWDADWSPRIEGLFDIASGDDDPNDGQNNRFDTLFGARRFEFGPTGIFGAFARANLLTPGIRFVSKPAQDWELMITHRFHYLASDTDAWTTTGIRDATGNSGSHIGNLTEFRARYDFEPKSVRLEFGMAYLAAGGFAEAASDGLDSLYSYAQLNFAF